MIKWIIAVVLILAMLSVAGCCCCSSGYDGYYSTVGGQDTASAGGNCGQCDTPYDCTNGVCSGSCACQK